MATRADLVETVKLLGEISAVVQVPLCKNSFV